MPASRYNVTTSSTRLVTASDNPGGVSIRNESATDTVYLDDRQQGSTTAGMPLSPLSTIQWAQQTEVWAVAPVAAEVVVSQSAGAVADPSVIASALIDQGLPEAIAANIRLQGAPSIDEPVLLLNSTTQPGPVITALGSPLDVKQYQSVTISAQALMAAALPVPASPTASHVGQILAYHYQAGIFIGHDNFRFLGDDAQGTSINSSARLSIPVRGDTMQVYALYGTAGVDVRVRVVGSYRNVETPSFYGGHGFWGQGGGGAIAGDAGLLSWSIGGLAAGAIEYEYPTLYAGELDLTVDTTGTLAPNLIAELRDVSTDTIVEGFFLAAGTVRDVFTKRMIVPQRPLKLRVAVTGAGALGANARVVLRQERGR